MGAQITTFSRRAGGVAAAMLLGATLAPVSANEAPRLETTAPVLWQQSMNVFRRHEVPSSEMFWFYGDVLGLNQLQTFDVGDDTLVARFMVGQSELKMTHRVPDRNYVPGGLEDATGLRLLTFFYPEREPVLARFREEGVDAPQFRDVPGTSRQTAIVYDPDGHAVELVIAPNEPEEIYNTIEIGLMVRDLDVSKEFYAGFVGLKEEPAVQNRWGDSKKVTYRHGTTLVSLHHVGRDLPADTGTGGIQYVVTNVDAVGALAEERGVTIDQPLSNLPGFQLRTIWLFDPDHVTNYFAQTGPSGAAQGATQGATQGAAQQ